MSGPVTAMPSAAGNWTAMWRFAMAHGTTTRRFKDAMQRAGYQIIMVAGEPQVRQADVDAYIKSIQLNSQPINNQEPSRRAEVDYTLIEVQPTKLSKQLEDQALELEQLRRKVEQLLANKGGAE